MKISSAAVAIVAVVASSLTSSTYGFVPASSLSSSSFASASRNVDLSPRAPSSRHVATLRMSAASFNVGVVGATGAVGKEIVGVLEKRAFPVGKLRIFGSERSAGREIDTQFGKVTVELFSESSARECDVVFLAVDGDFSLKHAEAICEGSDGAIVIDNSSAFRYKEGIPLVVPEINADATKGKKLIANPNCTTAIGLMAIWPLHKLFGLQKMVMSVRVISSHAVGLLRGWMHPFYVHLVVIFWLPKLISFLIHFFICRHVIFHACIGRRRTKLPPAPDSPAWTSSWRALGRY